MIHVKVRINVGFYFINQKKYIYVCMHLYALPKNIYIYILIK
jgi:hypothetical protein